jgi:hypothetical protein
MFRNDQSEEELQEIKSLLVKYLSSKAVAEADKAFIGKGYTDEIFETWKNEHFRKVS